MAKRRSKAPKSTPENQIISIKHRLKLPYCAKTPGQRDYMRAIHQNDIIFCLGVAGTGKTALATQTGFQQVQGERYGRLIISRPTVGSGRTSGFLPGSIEQKMAPFLEPIFDEIENAADSQEEIKKLQQDRVIRIVPFEYMRGRNFHDSFILIDEAQNCKKSELWLLLSRFGQNSKLVITGDPTQSDLPVDQQGGLEYYARLFAEVEGVATVWLTEDDVVRSEMVRRLMNRLREEELRLAE